MLASSDKRIFIEKVPEELLCPICKTPCVNPKSGCAEGHTFCNECITQWIQVANRKCPVCRDPINLVNNLPVKQLIQKLRVKCPNTTSRQSDNNTRKRKRDEQAREEGAPPTLVKLAQCPWTGTVEHLEGHLSKTCAYQLVDCVNVEHGCDAKQQPRAWTRGKHEPKCPFRLVNCSECTQRVQKCQLKTHKRQDCKMRIVPCPHGAYGCDKRLVRGLVKVHTRVCEFKPVKCFLSEHGCFETTEMSRPHAHEHARKYAHVHTELVAYNLTIMKEAMRMLAKKTGFELQFSTPQLQLQEGLFDFKANVQLRPIQREDEQKQRPPPPSPFSAGIDNPILLQTPNTPEARYFNHVATSIVLHLNECPHEVGMSQQELASRTRFNQQDVQTAINLLVDDGYIYSTVDEHHFASVLRG